MSDTRIDESKLNAFLAATGDVHGLEVVTRNSADLARCGARCVNPWR